MSRTGSRKAWLGLVAVAATMALGSTAFACVTYTGKLTVRGQGLGESVNIGNGKGMTFCPGYPKGKAKAALGGQVSISVTKSPIDSCGEGRRLRAGDYLVAYAATGAYTRSDPYDTSNKDGSRVRKNGCSFVAGPTSRTLGTVTVDDLGKAAGTFTLPTDVGTKSGPTDEAAICIVDVRFGNTGNIAPLTII